MHTALVKLLLLATGAAAAPAASTSACNEDNCVTSCCQASAFPTRHGTADCMSYFMTTVTPATSTSTVTVTATGTTTNVFTITNTGTSTATIPITITVPETVTVTIPDAVTFTARAVKKRFEMADLVQKPMVSLAPRQVTVGPSAIPSYASTCSGSVHYSSAWSCVGVTASTTTAPSPVTTTTVTVTTVQTSAVTETSSAIVVVDVSTTVLDTVIVATATVGNCAGPTPTFVLAGTGRFAGQYAQVTDSGNHVDDVIVFGPQASASTVSINAASFLFAGADYANRNGGGVGSIFYFNTVAQIAAGGYASASCSIGAGDLLACFDQSATRFQLCPGLTYAGSGVVLGSALIPSCTPLTFVATCL
ncbi:hypothetical protein MMC26_002320 [Xylographa opegraphella]|nr:hypothetical protein [Xylographa opegraphella]